MFRSALGLAATLLAGAALAQSPPSASAPPPGFAPSATQPTVRPAPDMQAVLDAHAKLGPKPIETLTPAEARRQPSPADGALAVMRQRGIAVDRTVSTRELAYGKDPLQKARIYSSASRRLNKPVVVYYHGGGWVIADLDTYDATPRAMAKALDAIVVSVEYRKAPEAKFPAQHDDAIAAYEWTLANAKSWGADPTRVVLAGESAGGNLAVATAIAARDRNLAAPVHVLAVYPIANTSPDTAAKAEFANARPLNTPMLQWFTHYTVRAEADAKDPRINLVSANLKGLPPTTIVNAQIDPLLSDGETLAAALKAAGVAVEQRTFPGATHEFFGMAAVVASAREAQAYAVGRIKPALSAPR